jgi:hypothetical protein
MAPTLAGRDIAVAGLQGSGILGDVGQQGPQILHVEQQPAVLVGDMKDDVDHAFLHLVEIQKPRQQHRAHLAQGRSDRVALLALDVPEHDRIGRINEPFLLLQAHFGNALGDPSAAAPRLTDPGKVALDIGQKDRHPDLAESLGEALERHRFTRTRGTRDQTMAIGHARKDRDRLRPLADEDGLGHIKRSLFGEDGEVGRKSLN